MRDMEEKERERGGRKEKPLNPIKRSFVTAMCQLEPRGRFNLDPKTAKAIKRRSGALLFFATPDQPALWNVFGNAIFNAVCDAFFPPFWGGGTNRPSPIVFTLLRHILHRRYRESMKKKERSYAQVLVCVGWWIVLSVCVTGRMITVPKLRNHLLGSIMQPATNIIVIIVAVIEAR